MNAVQKVMKLHSRNTLLWFIAPWIFQLTAFLVSLLDGLLFHRDGQWFSSGGAGDIYIFFFFVGIFIINDTFPFALSFGVRRKAYVLGTLALVALLSAATALTLVTLGMVENQGTDGWGVGLHFFAPPYLSDGSFLQQWWVDFSLLVHLFAVGFVISSIYRRFGSMGIGILFAFLVPVLTTAIVMNAYGNRWGMLFAWFGQHSAFELALWVLPVTVFFLLVSYLLLRRAVV